MVDNEGEEEEKRPSPRALGLFLLAGTLVLSIAFALVWTFSSKPIEKLVIEGLSILSTQEILDGLGVEPGSLATIESSWKTWEKSLLANPRIRTAKVTRTREGLLLVQIQEKKAEFILHIGRDLYEMDEEFGIISKNQVRQSGILVLSGNFIIAEGKVTGTLISDITLEMRSAFQAFPELKQRLSELSIQNDGEFLLYSKSPFRSKIYLGDKLSMLQFRKLYATFAFLENQGTKASEIDLRGEDAVYH